MEYVVCYVGYYGRFCNKICFFGIFGVNCVFNCGFVCINKYCNYVIGCIEIIEDIILIKILGICYLNILYIFFF